MTIGLTNPTVLGTAGPTYATMQNAEMDLIDAHDHSAGRGTQVPHGGTSSGTLIAGNFSYTGYGPINQSYSSFTATALPTPAVHPASLLVDTSGNLYYEDTSGNQVALVFGGVIVPTGTGADNGFFGTYATTAKVTYEDAIDQYRFANTYADFTGTGTNAANVAVGSLYVRRIIAYPIRIGNSWDTNAPIGGFAFESAAATGPFLIGADPTSAGTYTTTTALRLDSITSATAYSYGLGINNGSANGTATIYPLMVNAAAVAGSAIPAAVARFGANVSGGTILAGFGARIVLSAPTSAGTGFVQQHQAAISSIWGNTIGTNGGITISGAAATGTLTAIPGIQVVNYGGIDYVGLGGPASSTGQAVVFYGHVFPSANNTWDIGNGTQVLRAAYSRAVTSDAALTLAGTSVVLSGNTSLTGTFTGTSSIAGTLFIPSTGPSSGSAYQLNQSNIPYGWANCSNAGAINRGYNVTALSHPGTGTFNYTLNAAISTNAVIVATCSDSDLRTVRGYMTSSTTCSILIATGSTGAAIDAAHSFVIMGA